VAVQLLAAVRACGVRDPTLRDQALRAAKSACLNCAEGAARSLPGEKRRAFSIARAEAAEAAAAVEIAVAGGDARAAAAAEVLRLAGRVYAMLTPLART
jgi:four helix bundle protein